jgi:hypothetical protein
VAARTSAALPGDTGNAGVHLLQPALRHLALRSQVGRELRALHAAGRLFGRLDEPRQPRRPRTRADDGGRLRRVPRRLARHRHHLRIDRELSGGGTYTYAPTTLTSVSATIRGNAIALWENRCWIAGYPVNDANGDITSFFGSKIGDPTNFTPPDGVTNKFRDVDAEV